MNYEYSGSREYCEKQEGCKYIPPGPCYCPPNVVCACGGGASPKCIPEARYEEELEKPRLSGRPTPRPSAPARENAPSSTNTRTPGWPEPQTVPPYRVSQGPHLPNVVHKEDWETQGAPGYSISAGNPQMARSPAGGRALAFDISDNEARHVYDQIRYSLGEAGTRHQKFALSCDLYLHRILGSDNKFTIFFDMPSVRTITFTSKGAITVFPAKGIIPLASFKDGQKMHLVIATDLSTKTWRITANGMEVYSGLFDGRRFPGQVHREATELRSIRFSLGNMNSSPHPDPLPLIYLDNVLITAGD